MNDLHNVTITVFVHETDDVTEIRHALLSWFPFSLEERKIPVNEHKATGVYDNTILIWSVTLAKKRDVNTFVTSFFGTLSQDIRNTLRQQMASRLGSDMRFFIRFDKHAYISQRKRVLVDHGDCFHIAMTVACYPKNRGEATRILDKLLNSSSKSHTSQGQRLPEVSGA